jgi:hypothetical protein
VNLSAELPEWSRFPYAEDWLKRNIVASAPVLNEQELRTGFSKFLHERSRLERGGRAIRRRKRMISSNYSAGGRSSQPAL